MGKPFGEGLKYMRLDTDVHDNDKIDILRDEFEDAGFVFWTLLHCRVFKYSYYMSVDERTVARFCKKNLRKPVEDFYKMLDFSIKIKIFDREYYEKYKIITSKGIQNSYLDITKKWSKVKIIPAYMIEEVNIQPFQLCFYSINGNYLGYKKKNSDEIFNDEFVPRKHEKKPQEEETRAEVFSTAVTEYFENRPEQGVNKIPKEPDVPKQTTAVKPPVNGLHTPPNNPKQTLTFYSESKIAKDILEFWDFNVISNSPMHHLVSHFLYAMDGQSLLDRFTEQCYAYIEYKNLSGGKRYRHSLPNFLGNHKDEFIDGVWQSENWVIKLKEELKVKTKKNGKETRRGYAPEGGYGEI